MRVRRSVVHGVLVAAAVAPFALFAVLAVLLGPWRAALVCALIGLVLVGVAFELWLRIRRTLP
ncbi:hypothetical protein [Micromonospora sp. NPDC049645]|uniref:hypothetical protein n=1 Tax=Micromonospora sp. NPDC049645 TaxID=3155508 RepID=UPI0034321E81